MQKARFAAGLPAYLSGSLDPRAAHREVRRRVASRGARFVEVVDALMLRNLRAPYRELLANAKWDRVRLERSVGEAGVEGTLARLAEDGVWISSDEFRGRASVDRGGLRVPTHASDFDNPLHMGRAISGGTSGTTGAPMRVAYDWGMFAEEASLESLLMESHDLLDSPWAMWLPAPPAMAGMHNLFVHIRVRRPPEVWFSPVAARRADRVLLGYVRGVARARGMRLPAPEHRRLGEAAPVARWLSEARDRAGRAALKTFASSAVRVAEAARRLDIDLSGCVLLPGGEPLTPRRRSYIESTGAEVFGRYVATETGWIAGACSRLTGDSMHLYTDRVAVVVGDGSGPGAGRLLMTTLSPTSGKLLLNADIGDSGTLGAGSCACPLGSAGLDQHLSAVRPHDRLAGEGMTVPATTVGAILDDLVADAGCAPDGWQLAETEDEAGRSRLVVTLSPHVPVADREVASSVLDRLAREGHRVAADTWGDAGTLVIDRGEPRATGGSKTPALAPDRRLDPHAWSRIYEGPVDGRSLIFRRGADLALRLCAGAARPGESWVDVGCGSGHLARALSRRGVNVVGIDGDPRMVRAAEGRWGAEEGSATLRFAVGRAEALPFGDDELDGVVATSLMGCLTSPEGMIAEVARALRPGGTVVLTFTNRASVLHRLPSRLRPQRTPDSPVVLPAVRTYRRDDVLRLCEAAGMRVVQVRYYNFFVDTRAGLVPPREIAFVMERALHGRAGSFVGRNLIAVAKKPG